MPDPTATGKIGPLETEAVHTRRIVTVSIIAALAGFLFGYDASIGMFVTLGILTLVFQPAPEGTQAILDAGGQSGCAGQSELNTPILGVIEGRISVLALNAFVAFFASTWGPVLWVMLGEMFPSRMRAAALSIAVMANWIANFIVSMSFPGLVQVSLGLAYGLVTAFALLSFFYVTKYVRETNGVELEDMAELEGVRG